MKSDAPDYSTYLFVIACGLFALVIAAVKISIQLASISAQQKYLIDVLVALVKR